MNEWSPGGNYSSPGTISQTGRLLRSQWDESEKGTKHLVSRPVPENKNRTFQQHSMEDISKTLLVTSARKNGGNGISDPRFKHVISSGVQNDACVGTEVKTSLYSLSPAEREPSFSKFPVRNEYKGNKLWVDCVKSPDQAKLKPKKISESTPAAGDSKFNQSQDHLKAVDKLSFSHDILLNTVPKESLSECTVSTRNTSLPSEDFSEELADEVRKVPSSARVKKVQNWIQGQTSKPEKKHSVITVIGQMQEPDNISSALQEINKRRKLVKELDKFAVCKRIVELDKEKEISDLINQISYLGGSSSKGVLSTDSSETLNTCPLSLKTGEGNAGKNSSLNKENISCKADDVTSGLSISLEKKSSASSKLKNEQSASNSTLKGKLQILFSNLLYRRMLCFMIIMSGLFCWLAILLARYGTYDFFNSKPKPVTWYERICSWLWELFRPAANYQRSKPWSSY